MLKKVIEIISIPFRYFGIDPKTKTFKVKFEISTDRLAKLFRKRKR